MRGVAEFIEKAERLKLIPRSGWLKIGIKSPESVAEHSFMTAVISFILAYLESGNVDVACRACAAAVFHDIEEAITLDMDYESRKYVRVEKERALNDMLSALPKSLEEAIIKLLKENEKFVKDADKLELLFQTREYEKVYYEAAKFKPEKEELMLETSRKMYEVVEQ